MEVKIINGCGQNFGVVVCWFLSRYCLSPLGTLTLVTVWSLEVLRVGLFSEVIIILVLSWGRVTWSLFRGFTVSIMLQQYQN